ncbi:hypothetical protein GCM10023115_25540 [Pontixanthobacter gangjinensis]|uniref:Glycosyltransferase family 2 protein n=1 Tax=Christiangramia aestuarii TaxID=1028746 RepID=A0A7K1LLT7_9FLAO|nr:glycosyltransferase family A protein [Christiangramia aestuarii]MUP41789.1 glycosyltransferase family 2 protein [Christiangramia aestuarii]
MNPVISIIIPAYNRCNFIGETLDSVINQSYSKWECLVIDDSSTDNTKELLDYYCLKDRRIKFFSRPGHLPKGSNSCRNYGIELSKGEYLQFLDSDDLLEKNKLKAQVETSVGNDLLITGKWGGFLNSSNLRSRFKYTYGLYRDFNSPINMLQSMGFYNEFFPMHVYLIPKKLIEKAGKWNENIVINQDGEFLSRIILKASKVLFSNDSIAYYRYGSGQNLSDISNIEKARELIKSWEIIEENIKSEGYNKTAYVANAKFLLQLKFKVIFPKLLKEKSQFFYGAKDYSKWYNRIFIK